MPERYQNYTALQISRDNAVLTVTLDNPPHNAMTREAHRELTRIWSDAAEDKATRVIILTGAGDRSFCAGGDLNRMIGNWGDHAYWDEMMAEAYAIITGMLACPKPVISRINGHAIGLGASIALAGDITIAVADAKIGDAHIDVGLAACDGGALLWPHLVGLVEARRALLSGKPLRGQEAADKGLVTQAVSQEDLDGCVKHWTEAFLSKSPVALRATKEALNLDLLDRAKRQLPQMLELETHTWKSRDHLEALHAILEKRAPRFSNE